jgi:hypothetical protein
VKKLKAILDYVAPYEPCTMNGWLWVVLLCGIVILIYACATTPEMCEELY